MSLRDTAPKASKTPSFFASMGQSVVRNLIFTAIVATGGYIYQNSKQAEIVNLRARVAALTPTNHENVETEIDIAASLNAIYENWHEAHREIKTAINVEIALPPSSFNQRLPSIGSLEGSIVISNDGNQVDNKRLQLEMARIALENAKSRASSLLESRSADLNPNRTRWLHFIVDQSDRYLPTLRLICGAFASSIEIRARARTIDIASLGHSTAPASRPAASRVRPQRSVRRPASPAVGHSDSGWGGGFGSLGGGGYAGY